MRRAAVAPSPCRAGALQPRVNIPCGAYQCRPGGVGGLQGRLVRGTAAMHIRSPVKPMLAVTVDRIPPPQSCPGGCLYEPKFDGFRAVARVDEEGAVDLWSRRRVRFDDAFPEIVEAVRERIEPGTVVDGEIVRLGEDWAPRLRRPAAPPRRRAPPRRVRADLQPARLRGVRRPRVRRRGPASPAAAGAPRGPGVAARRRPLGGTGRRHPADRRRGGGGAVVRRPRRPGHRGRHGPQGRRRPLSGGPPPLAEGEAPHHDRGDRRRGHRHPAGARDADPRPLRRRRQAPGRRADRAAAARRADVAGGTAAPRRARPSVAGGAARRVRRRAVRGTVFPPIRYVRTEPEVVVEISADAAMDGGRSAARRPLRPRKEGLGPVAGSAVREPP